MFTLNEINAAEDIAHGACMLYTVCGACMPRRLNNTFADMVGWAGQGIEISFFLLTSVIVIRITGSSSLRIFIILSQQRTCNLGYDRVEVVGNAVGREEHNVGCVDEGHRQSQVVELRLAAIVRRSQRAAGIADVAFAAHVARPRRDLAEAVVSTQHVRQTVADTDNADGVTLRRLQRTDERDAQSRQPGFVTQDHPLSCIEGPQQHLKHVLNNTISPSVPRPSHQIASNFTSSSFLRHKFTAQTYYQN